MTRNVGRIKTHFLSGAKNFLFGKEHLESKI